MKLGNLNITNLKLGGFQIKKVMSGVTLVWSYFQMLVDKFKTRVLGNLGQFEGEACLEAQLNDLDDKSLLDSASLIITPNGYKEQTLYSVTPSPVGTNLLLRSEEFDNSYWNKTRCSIVSNQEIAPNGTLTADYVVDDNTTGLRYVGVIGVPTSIGQTYTFSVFVKKKDRSRIMFQINEGGSLFPTVVFDFDTQVFTQTTPLLTSSFQSVGNGWFRIILTRTPTTGTSSVIGIFPTDVNGNYSGIGDGVSRTIIWGAQLEIGTTVGLYIPTTTRQAINETICDLVVTRATTATRVKEDGLVEVLPYNLLSYSEAFENGYWTKLGSYTLIPNATIAPDGTLTADLFTKTGAINTVVSIIRGSLYTTTGAYTLSFYCKQNVGDIVLFRIDAGGNSCNCLFNFTTKTLTNTGANVISSSYEELPDGWFRLILVGNVIATNWSVDIANLFGNPSNDSVYVWGAQLVKGTKPKDYFPTTNRLNIPRIDWTDLSCPRISVEPQRTNLFLQSEDFTNGWSQEGSSITGNTEISPDGFLTADSIFELGTNDVHRTYRPAIAVTANAYYTASFYVKKANVRYVRLVLTQNGSTTIWAGAQFDLDTQTFTSQVGTEGGEFYSASMIPFTNGWYRIVVSGSIPGTGMIPILALSDGSDMLSTDTRGCPIYLGDTSNSLYVWGAQFELGENVTSYIPTTTSTVTRNADSIININLSSFIGQTEGTILVKGAQFSRGIVFRIRNNTNTGVNRLTIFCTGTNGRVEVGVMKDGVNVSAAPVTPVNVVNEKNIIMVYSQNIFKAFISGQLIYEYNYPTPTDFTSVLNTVEFGSLSEKGTATFDLIALWKNQITDEQAINLTTL